MPPDVPPIPGRLAILSIGLGRGGGAERQIVRLATTLRARGWFVAVITLLAPEDYVDELRAGGVEVHTVGVHRRLDPRPFVRLARTLRRLDPDVLVTFMFHANVIGRILGRLVRIPTIVSSVRADRFGGAWRDRLLAITDRLADATTTNSHYVADQLVGRGVVRRGRIHVTPNAVTVPAQLPTADEVRRQRSALGVPDDAFVWVAAGALAWRKDYPTLLRAVARLVGDDVAPGIVLVAGHGPDEAAIRALATELGVDPHVRFLGYRSDATAVMGAADAFVASSCAEGMPNAVAEALAVGKPVVATRVGGTPELVAEGVSGYLVPIGDPSALADAMRRLMDRSPDERRAMGAAGRAHVTTTFRLDHVIDRWETLLGSLLAGQARGRARSEREAGRERAR